MSSSENVLHDLVAAEAGCVWAVAYLLPGGGALMERSELVAGSVVDAFARRDDVGDDLSEQLEVQVQGEHVSRRSAPETQAPRFRSACTS